MMLAESGNAARQASQRLQNIGSGAASGSTSFFVLAPVVPCILAAIVDAPESIRADLHYRQEVQLRKQEEERERRGLQQIARGGGVSPSTQSLQPQSPQLQPRPPSWLGSLIAVAYESAAEEVQQQQHDDAEGAVAFEAMELLEEAWDEELFQHQQQRRSPTPRRARDAAENFWTKRQQEDDEDVEGDDQELLHHDTRGADAAAASTQFILKTLEQEQQQQQQQQAHRSPAVPSEFQKHLDEWKRMHHIEVPNTGGNDALQLRGGKSSVVTWAQRELDAYRRIAAQSQQRLKKLRKQADKVMSVAEGTMLPAQMHQQQSAVSSQHLQDHEPDPDTVGGSGIGGAGARIQMLRRIVASKSVLALQAMSTVPASGAEAAIWTHAVPPRPASAILSVLANNDEDNIQDQHLDGDDELMEMLMAAKEQQHEDEQQGGDLRRRRSSLSPNRKKRVSSFSMRPQSANASNSNNNNNSSIKAQAKKQEADPLQRLMQDRMELLLGGVSPGVIIAEATQPRVEATSLQSRAEIREERRRRANEARIASRGRRGAAAAASTNTNSEASSSSLSRAQSAGTTRSSTKTKNLRNISELDPHKPATPMVLVQKTPGERRRILEEMQQHNQQQLEIQRNILKRQQIDESAGIATPAVSSIGAGEHAHHHHHDSIGGGKAATTASSSSPAARPSSPPLLGKLHRQFNAPQPQLWDFGHQLRDADDIHHWNLVQQLAVKVMQQPGGGDPKNAPKKNVPQKQQRGGGRR